MEAELESIQHESDNNSQQEHDNSDVEPEEAQTRSHVWSYFTRDPNFKENKKATCNLCRRSYTCSGGSTSNLSKHLKNRHNLLRTGTDSQQQGLDIRDAFNMKKWAYNNEEMTNKLIQWIIMNQHPFTLVEEPYFIDLIHSLHPAAEILSADTLKRRLIELYDTNLEKIKNILKEMPGKISFTTDIWTSPSTKSFISLTAHFIDKTWKLRSLIVDFFQLSGQHTGENIKNAFVLSLEHLSIKDKLFGITLDNASNNKAFIDLLILWANNEMISFSSENHFRCFAHTINLGVQEFLKSLSYPLELIKLRQFISKIRASVQRREKLSKACEIKKIKDLKPILDVSTRWNSTYEMISRALYLKPALEYIAANDRELREFEFNEKRWKEFEVIEEFLKIFQDVTTLMSGCTYPTLSLTIPLFNILIDHVEDTITSIEESNENENNEDNENSNFINIDIESKNMIKEAVTACKIKLLRYYNKTNDTYLISTILDPRLKLDYYKEHEWEEDMILEIKQKFLNTYNNHYVSSTSTSTPTNDNPTAKRKNSITKRLFKRRHHQENNTNEGSLYLSFPSLPDQEIDPLEWWRINESTYPNLAKMARDYLSIPSTSVPSEQCFSLSKNLITDNRNRLAGKTVRICMTLKSWWKFLDSK